MNESNIEGNLFIFFMMPPWNGVWTRQNHFSIRLVKAGAKVLYVEEPPAISTTIKKKKWNSILRSGSTVYTTAEGVDIMKLPFQLPGSLTSNKIANLNAIIASASIKKWVNKNKWNTCTIWCRVPASVFILNYIKHEKLVYDITDDYELYAKNERIKKKTAERERMLAFKANHVFITSEALKQKDTLQDINTHYLPNGVEFDLFSSVDNNNVKVNEAIAGINKPVIGYVGLVSYWMDFKLLEILGEKYSGHVILIGPIMPQIEAKFKSIKGLKWIDLVPQKELPGYIKGFDVCIMPHQVSELRKRANPLKIWEYLATGKPFVSVDLPALKPAEDYVYIAKTHQQFVEMIDNLLANAEPIEFKEKRKSIACNYSWNKIFNDLKSKLYAS